MSAKVSLHLTGMKSTKFGSLETYLIELIRELNSSGYKSVVQYEETPTSEAYLHQLKDLGCELVVLRTSGRSLQRLWGIASLVWRYKPSNLIAHFLGRPALILSSFIALLAGTKQRVTFVHNVQHRKRSIRSTLPFWFCTSVLAVSDAVNRDLIGGGLSPEKVRTHYLGLFEQEVPQNVGARIREEFSIPSEAVVLVNIAFDAPFKGVDRLVEAMSLLAPTRKDVYLIQLGADFDFSYRPPRNIERADSRGHMDFRELAGGKFELANLELARP